MHLLDNLRATPLRVREVGLEVVDVHPRDVRADFAGALPFALPLGSHDASDWALVGYLGVFQIALAYVLVTKALETLPALEASLILLIEPALNPVWAWVFQGERPGAWALAGGGVILGATTARSVLDARRTYRIFISSRANYWRAMYRFDAAIGKQVLEHEERAPRNPVGPRP